MKGEDATIGCRPSILLPRPLLKRCRDSLVASSHFSSRITSTSTRRSNFSPGRCRLWPAGLKRPCANERHCIGDGGRINFSFCMNPDASSAASPTAKIVPGRWGFPDLESGNSKVVGSRSGTERLQLTLGFVDPSARQPKDRWRFQPQEHAARCREDERISSS